MDTLIIACCGSKLDHEAPALELYQSRAFDLVRNELTERFHVLILSAKYWLVRADSIIEPYDVKMTKTIAKNMLTWCAPLYAPCELYKSPGDLYVYGGKLYRDVVKGWESRYTRQRNVVEVVGRNRGCGDHFSALQELAAAHTDCSEGNHVPIGGDHGETVCQTCNIQLDVA